MPGINPIWITTTILTRLSNGQQKGCATGFFFSEDQHLYIVTNKHVIYGKNHQNSQPLIDAIKLNLHTNPSNTTQNEELTISLFEETHKKWLEHSHPAVDVILIPLTIDKTRFTYSTLDKNFIDSGNIVVEDFEKIFVMGYPFGWYDRVNNLPITRIGHLSSPFKAPFQGMPIMLGDVVTHPGMSGGPVFMELVDFTTRDKNGALVRYVGKKRLLLVGINSGQFALPSETEERVNLISIWFPELILEILHP